VKGKEKRQRSVGGGIQVPRGAESPKIGHLVLLCAVYLLGPARTTACADDAPLIRNNFGSVGLIDMPSARTAPDGDLSFGATYFQNTQRYDLGFQALPWLETDIRYSGLDHFNGGYPVYWDRSFAIKARLWQETDVLPAVALGIDDLIGTGVYSGEYLVGSKQFGNFDFSLGIGWGRLGSTGLFKNPIALVFPSFAKDRGDYNAGGTTFGTLFHGPTSGLFGGVAWQTPIKNLSLIAEYSSDMYTQEAKVGNFSPLNQMNYGLSYRVTDTIALGLDWLYGRSIGGNIFFEMDPTTDYPQRIGPAPPPAPPIRSAKQQQEALNLMLGGRGEHTMAAPEQFGSNAGLVDALWRENGDLIDVTVQGQRLFITIADGDPDRACRAAARTIGLYSVTITAVSVSNGGKRLSCPVAAAPALALLTPNVGSQLNAITFSQAITPAAFITIDATIEPEPDAKAAIARIRADANRQRILIDAINVSGAELIVYYTNSNYFSEANALDRLTRLLMSDAPPQIEKFRLIAVVGDIPQREFDVLRAPAERSFAQDGKLNFADNVASAPAPMENPVLSAAERGTYPKFSWDIFPQLRQELFDPSNPLGVQFLAGASGTAELLPGLSLNGEVEANIWDNFNTNRPSDSLLPHVRTDFAQYFTQGKNGIGDLEGDYNFRISPDVFAIVRAGYLESMFAGVGGEVLWRPEEQRWALGGDLYEVQQRDFDRLFGLQPYRTLTGHVSLYYASPWYGLNFIVRAGQYLAGDRGVTFEMSRRFSTGVEIGAFFTKTNVSAAQFGEGSFDKGIVLRIPIGWVAPIDTQTELGTVLRPVQRDGGQELSGDAILYDETRRTSISEFALESFATAN
jgi:hypothetical protein